MNIKCIVERSAAAATVIFAAVITVSSPAFAGFNADAPNQIRRIFTQLALAEGRLVSYHVLEPGPAGVQAFPTGGDKGALFRFPNNPNLRPVLDDSAAPSSSNNIILDNIVREVFNVTLSRNVQPKSASDVFQLATSMRSIGFVNAPSVPAPIGAPVPSNQQESADQLWGPVPNVGVVDVFAGGNLSPQHVQGKTLSGLPIANVQQPNLRRPRISAYAAGQLVYFITYETKNLSQSGLVSAAIEAQWSSSGFPGDRDLFFCAYSVDELKATGIRIEDGIFAFIECPILATDVNDDGNFANTSQSKELVTFANVDWDGNGLPDDGVSDPNSTLK
jgi:hypothetical protein